MRLNGHQIALFASKEDDQRETAVPPPPPNFDDDFADYAIYGPPPDDEPPPEWSEPPPLAHLPSFSDPLTALKQVFGYDEFRPLQADVIQNVLNRQDSLTIMPTGSGKSLCYQIPALLFPGLTVVVSPLISLMEDQVMQLREVGVTAVFLNSTLSRPEYQWTSDQIRAGAVKLLYVAPETLLRPETLLLLEQAHVDCLTIDEAHCISAWGHDFRPEYRQLVAVRRRLPTAVCIAVTATATARVRQDIKHSLGIAAADEFIASFDRDNLHLAVAAKSAGLRQAAEFLQAHRGEAGIIYCATRKQVDQITEQLTAQGWPVLPYHAGLDDATRRQNQKRFTLEEGVVMVATIAFGMGINKSNVRFILHYDLPQNLESYYQQIGRAGRDGLRADCLLLFSYADVQTINFFIQQQEPSQQAGARARLEAMIGFVETMVCRRRPLLAYFGETYTQDNCDLCDNCQNEQGELADLTIPAQKFLACVKRTGEMFGLTHIIDVLRGSQSQKVLARGHDRLSTYNIGGEYSKQEWQFLARQFIQQGLLVQDMEHGSLKLTAQAYAVFKGEPVRGLLPAQPEAVRPVTAQDYDTDLFARLRDRRTALAAAANVPPYVIFSDRSLVEMAIYFPQSVAAFGGMYGVGGAKLEKYADEFLPIIQAYCGEKGIGERLKTAVTIPTAARPATGSSRGRADEVADLFNAGHSVPELAAQFGVKDRTILNHLWTAVQGGRPLRPDSLLELSQLSPADQQRALAAFAELGTDYLRPVFEALEEAISYDELHLLRLVAATKNAR
ncbi:MAG: DNA helicase RecQ [Chloroflexi bacterium]|nr:DNA helicase RecQ [Chloroflexota bacterium]